LGTIIKKRRVKMKRNDVVLITASIIIILSFSLSTLLLPQKSFSQKENRPLAKAPSLSIENLISGKYFDGLSLFLKDQLPLRDSFVSLRSMCELWLGRSQVNGVISLGNTLVAIPKDCDAEMIKSNSRALRELCKKNILLYVPPRSIDIFRDALPSVYDYESHTRIMSALEEDTLSLLRDYLKDAKEGYYYRTDHHWTTEGAYFAYRQICRRLGVNSFDEEYFSKETVSSDFRGSSYSRSGLPEFAIDSENITLYRYFGDGNASIINRELDTVSSGFYNTEALYGADKYRVFLGGNYSHLSISLDTGEAKPKLLLIKDSFANSLIPFLTLHYDIEAIDPRYCTKQFLKKMLGSTEYDVALAVLSLDTLSQNIF
jgi:hypothetical protein